MIGLVFSDGVRNDLGSVASGPISPDHTTYADALNIVDRYNVEIPETVHNHLQQGSDEFLQETPNQKSEVFDNVFVHVLADNFTSLTAAKDVALERGYEPIILSSHIRGEASEVTKVHLSIAEEVVATGSPVDPPAVLISGAETTVTVSNGGKGGPNQEFALSVALGLSDSSTIVGSIDTDRIDGNVDVAGALVDACTIDDQIATQRALANNDVYDYLDTNRVLLYTGPTGTNVNDLRVVVIGENDVTV